MDNDRQWVGTWATSPAPSEAGVGFNNHTLISRPMTPTVAGPISWPGG